MIGNQAVAYYDKGQGRIVLSDVLVTGDSRLVLPADPVPALVSYSVGLNGAISYGQSLSMGQGAIPALTLDQPFYNVSFTGGVKAKAGSTVTSFGSLVEDNCGEDGAASATVGETICSSLANYSVRLAAIENGELPSNFRVFTFAPGKSGQPITALNKGAVIYNRMIGLVGQAVTNAESIGKTLTIQTIHWKQGEYENLNGNLTRAQYLEAILQLQIDVSADIKRLTGQVQDVHFLIYQTFAYHRSPGLGPAYATLAQFDAVNQSPYFHFVGPLYGMPHSSDEIHLTNVGEAWFGHYDGRAYKQLVVDGRKPDCVWPVSATLTGSTLTVRFTAPSPLKL